MAHACDMCPKTYKSKDSLTRHKALHHTGNESDTSEYECDKCSASYPTKFLLGTHYVTHGTKHHCPACEKYFAYARSLKLHKCFKSNKSNRHSCTHCNAQFTSKENLRNHTKECLHAKSGNKPLIGNSTSEMSTVNHECSHCGAVFSKKKELRRHEADCSKSIGSTSNTTNDQPANSSTDTDKSDTTFQCQHCKEEFQKKRHLRRHEPDCSKSIGSTSNTTNDQPASSSTSTDMPAKKLECPHCKTEFEKKRHLRRHEADCSKSIGSTSNTTNDQPANSSTDTDKSDTTFQCPHCKTEFEKKRHLRRHEPDCSKSIGSTSNTTNDQPASSSTSTDMPAKKLECPHCKTEFEKKRHLRRHEADCAMSIGETGPALEKRKSNAQTDAAEVKRIKIDESTTEMSDINHECSYCGAVFSDKRSLKKHTKICQDAPICAPPINDPLINKSAATYGCVYCDILSTSLFEQIEHRLKCKANPKVRAAAATHS